MSREKQTRRCISLTPGVYLRLREFAASIDAPMSRVVEHVINKELQKEKDHGNAR